MKVETVDITLHVVSLERTMEWYESIEPGVCFLQVHYLHYGRFAGVAAGNSDAGRDLQDL